MIYIIKQEGFNSNLVFTSSCIFDRDSVTFITYSTDYHQCLTLESWFTNLEQTPLNRSQQLPVLYKRLIDKMKRN